MNPKSHVTTLNSNYQIIEHYTEARTFSALFSAVASPSGLLQLGSKEHIGYLRPRRRRMGRERRHDGVFLLAIFIVFGPGVHHPGAAVASL